MVDNSSLELKRLSWVNIHKTKKDRKKEPPATGGIYIFTATYTFQGSPSIFVGPVMDCYDLHMK